MSFSYSQIQELNEILSKNAIVNGDCIEWTGDFSHQGYGILNIYKRQWKVDRLNYLLKHGSLPSGLNICHKCKNKKCFNIDHLICGSHNKKYNDVKERKSRFNKNLKLDVKNTNRLSHDELISNLKMFGYATVSEFAMLLQTSNHTVRKMIKEGRLQYIKLSNKKNSACRIPFSEAQRICAVDMLDVVNKLVEDRFQNIKKEGL